jgi:hypothetical protein
MFNHAKFPKIVIAQELVSVAGQDHTAELSIVEKK